MQHLLGNESIQAYLQKALLQSQVHHALLFSGMEGIGKSLFAKALALDLLEAQEARIQSETHPDLHILRPDGKSGTHSIERVRALIDEVHRPPFEAKRKVFILFDAERLQPTAANALLKTLEEPHLDSTIILLSSAPNELLPTILSRCSHLNFQPIPANLITEYLQQKHQIDPERAKLLARLSLGSLGAALRLHQNECSENAQQLLFDAIEGRIPAFQAIERIDALFSGLDGIDFHTSAEHLLAAYLMHARDGELRKSGGDSSLLYFSQTGNTIPLTTALARVEAVKIAMERNVKFSACLDTML